MSVIFSEIGKSKKSHNQTIKYKILNCQEKIDKSNNTTNWIDLKEIIKQSRELKIFNGLLNKSYNIVVKIGVSETIEKEYMISQQLSNIKGFILYLCYFNCTNKINKIVENSSICAKDGDKINILVMKEYKLGNIKFFNWNKDNFHILKSLIVQIFISLFLAFQEYGFIHNDPHFGNFLIKEDNDDYYKYNSNISIKLYGYRVIIMDFENSIFDETKNIGYNFLYKNFQQIINNIFFQLNIITNNKDEINKYIDDNLINKTIVDIKKLLSLIDNLSMIEKITLYSPKKYDPNIF